MRQAGPMFLDIDLGIAMIAYMMMVYGNGWAGAFALGQGILVDVFSAGPVGLFTFLYLSTFVAIAGGCRFFDLHSPRGQMILTAVAAFFKSLLLLLLLFVLSYDLRNPSSLVIRFALSAGLTGLLSPFLFFFLGLVKRRLISGVQEA